MTLVPGQSGKAAIEFAKSVAKSHGVEVAAWNDAPGKEFASLTGEGDRLQAFQEEMRSQGWYVWPPDPGLEGYMLDIALYPPPSVSLAQNGSGIVVDQQDSTALPAGKDFHYAGFGGSPIINIGLASILPLVVIWGNWTRAFGWSSQIKAIVSLAAVLLIGAAILPLQWIIVDADRTRLIISKGFRRKPQEIAISEIKKANVLREQESSVVVSRHIGIILKSGKALELSLPRQKQQDLVALLRANIRA